MRWLRPACHKSSGRFHISWQDKMRSRPLPSIKRKNKKYIPNKHIPLMKKSSQITEINKNKQSRRDQWVQRTKMIPNFFKIGQNSCVNVTNQQLQFFHDFEKFGIIFLLFIHWVCLKCLFLNNFNNLNTCMNIVGVMMGVLWCCWPRLNIWEVVNGCKTC